MQFVTIRIEHELQDLVSVLHSGCTQLMAVYLGFALHTSFLSTHGVSSIVPLTSQIF